MFALLGHVQFDLIAYFDGFESQLGADFAEHALIEGKPRLQFIGDKLDEIRIQLAFHLHYCDPEAELAKLRGALSAHEAMALVLGNGSYKGRFVLTDVQAIAKHTDKSGTLIALEASITLREFVGDKKNPRPPLAVQPRLPPATARTLPVGANIAPPASSGAVRDSIPQAVTSATQAQSELRVTVDDVHMTQKLHANPVAALGRAPGLLNGMKRVAAPLENLSLTLARLSGKLPEASDLLRAGDDALGAVRNAQRALSVVHVGTIVGRIDYVAGQLSAAAGALASVAPSISRLATKVVTRAL
ncbi:phage tail protein [Verminephrobacter aporrectodeae subsp. tuberculatae]|uniref:phage tail protein n=1 Tax=Verminephrobacter aporrectodeae TaxID=1110389 RepID=UPI002238B2E0|nr:phage tail protein [Verminephrobacter aporrectodeae]MCW5223528.1 phage tail protein [Verminephrobacter aporrectodeae subsp. tuberculatae]MCW5288993.1 phage tail protein [Verminephrobacter aporrectodeae subsp. tuberculatae]